MGSESPPRPQTSSVPELECAPEDLRLAWVTHGGNYGPAEVGLSPGGGFVYTRSLHGFDFVVRAVDGTAPMSVRGFEANPIWSELLVARERTLEVLSVPTGTTLRTITASPDAGSQTYPRGWFGAYGNVVFVAECVYGPNDTSRVILRRVDVDDGAESRVVLEATRCASWPTEVRFHSLDTQSAIVSGLVKADQSAHVLARVEFSTPHVLTRTLPANLGAPLLDVEVAPNAVTVAIALGSSFERFSTESLEPIGGALPIVSATANNNSYGPSIESPVALSTLATYSARIVDAEGTVAIADSDGHERARFRRAQIPAGGESGRDDAPVPIALRFVHDGFLVLTSRTLARYACRGQARPLPPPATTLELDVAMPTVARSGAASYATITARGAVLPTFHYVTISGEEAHTGSLLRELLVPPRSMERAPVDLRLELGVDDGFRRASTIRPLRVE